MADHSQFGSPTKEWLNHEAAYAPLPEPPIHTLPAQEIQKQVNGGREQASAEAMKAEGLAEKVQIKSIRIPARDGHDIPTRIYSPRGTTSSHTALPVYVFYHGGGFIYGTPDTEDATCSRIVAAMPIIVINVAYRHAPQNPYPAAHNDASDAFDWVMSNASSIGGDVDMVVVGGVSSGGNLAASVVLEKRGEEPRIRGLVLGIPYLVLNSGNFPADYHVSKDKASRIQCAKAPVLPMAVVDFFAKEFRGKSGVVVPDVGLASERDLAGFPSTAFLVAGNDPLRDDGFMFAEKMQRAGVPVKFHVFPGLPHAFRRFDDLKSSKRWDELTVESIQWTLSEQKPQVPPLDVKVEESTSMT
ncbi:AB hydrolase superfamily protein [Lachnellula occidentalis]|uniref:AB hydrolase superfamily protein n=1 Tax=Lachnellula occidentalis TaxID=215460 RepID=A0A8H8UJG6_9HELO|nr:AB hydrolase superfamily protein [Lachnellula occidentalis]